MVTLKQKLKGSSIIESTIAMMMLTLVFTVAFLSFDKVITSYSAAQKIRVEYQLKAHAEETIKDQLFLDDQIDYEDFYIKKTITPNSDNNKLYELNLEAFDYKNDRLLGNHRQLIKIQ